LVSPGPDLFENHHVNGMTSDRTHPALRRAARLLVIDPASGDVLLFQYEDSGRTWWATPGGALDGDETFEAAAIREAMEELAISALRFSPLWERTVEFSFRGTPVRQQERYFLVRLSRGEVSLGQEVQEEHAREGIVAARWWSPGELETSSERIFPEDLPQRVRDLTKV
jgi:8-oxo-dGTP pyrophosphatase MutT (NUDIX family)